jgi:outer membrane protein TolC
VRSSNSFQGGFGFTSGGLVSWEPFDFGLRKAQVNVARGTTVQSQAQVAVTALEAESRAADAFLSVLAARQVVKAAQAKVDRFQVFLQTVHVLAQKELRAQTDEYLAEAELVRSKDELIASEQNYKIAVAALIKWTGLPTETVEAAPGNLLKEASAQLLHGCRPAFAPAGNGPTDRNRPGACKKGGTGQKLLSKVLSCARLFMPEAAVSTRIFH